MAHSPLLLAIVKSIPSLHIASANTQGRTTKKLEEKLRSVQRTRKWQARCVTEDSIADILVDLK